MNTRAHRRILAECTRLLSLHSIPVTDSVHRIMEYFFSADHHVSLADIECFAEEEGLTITKPDIKKTIDLLVEFGFATKRIFADGVERYEHYHIGEHHDHLYCLKCGKIIEFYSSTLEEEQVEAAREHGFHAFSHKMQINGLCSQCFGEESQILPLTRVQSGGTFRIIEVSPSHGKGGGHGIVRRLHELGLVPGTEGQVMHNGRGMIVINIGQSRIALRRGQSHKIKVTLTN
ncbi:MAG: hypothetical protein GF401_12125 [Chitinivibrionales bacterium]|nr:hypothetical protein [Chitinivibrionales bacterium]